MRKERPILMSTPMVCAVLDDKKTVTRRIVKNLIGSTGVQDVYHRPDGLFVGLHLPKGMGQAIMNPFGCPYGYPGDLLWVREKWRKNEQPVGWPIHFYAKNDTYTNPDYEKWKPSIHMPKVCARLWLEVISVRIERLHDITETDCIREGIKTALVENYRMTWNYLSNEFELYDPKMSFKTLWYSINGSESWDYNPWVWRIEFKKIKP